MDLKANIEFQLKGLPELREKYAERNRLENCCAKEQREPKNLCIVLCKKNLVETLQEIAENERKLLYCSQRDPTWKELKEIQDKAVLLWVKYAPSDMRLFANSENEYTLSGDGISVSNRFPLLLAHNILPDSSILNRAVLIVQLCSMPIVEKIRFQRKYQQVWRDNLKNSDLANTILSDSFDYPPDYLHEHSKPENKEAGIKWPKMPYPELTIIADGTTRNENANNYINAIERRFEEVFFNFLRLAVDLNALTPELCFTMCYIAVERYDNAAKELHVRAREDARKYSDEIEKRAGKKGDRFGKGNVKSRWMTHIIKQINSEMKKLEKGIEKEWEGLRC